MRKTILLLICTFALCMFAQSANSQNLKSILKSQLPKKQTSHALSQSNRLNTFAAESKLDSIVYMNSDDMLSASHKKLSYSYNGDITTMITSHKTKEEGASWENDTKEEYSYDKNGYQTYYTYSYWDGTQWIKEEKDMASYNDNGTPLLESSSIWENNDWLEVVRIEYKYDASGNLLESLGFIIDDESFSRMDLKLIPSGTIPDLTITVLVKVGDQWVNMGKLDKKYNDDIKLLSEIEYEWDDDHWEADTKTVFTYNANSDILTEAEFLWNGQWMEAYRIEYTYDENYNCLSDTRYARSFTDGGFDKTFQYLYTYKDDRIISERQYMFIEDEEYPFYSGTYYYKGISSIDKVNAKSEIKIYPNPATEYIMFTLPVSSDNKASLKVMNITGSLTMSKMVISDQPVAVSHLPGGMYLYQVMIEGKTYSGKFLIK